MRLIRKGSGSMKKIFTVLFSICLFMMGVSASNESPTVKSEMLKDGSFDFKVTLTDMDLSTSTEYEWAIVANQAATPEDNVWSTVNDWTQNKVEFILDFSDDKIANVLYYVDKAYLLIREKNSQNVITDHVQVDVSIPYAYGAVPILDSGWKSWYVSKVFSGSSLNFEHKIASIKIVDQVIIDGYLNLKDEDGNINENELANYIDGLGLNSDDVPSTFNKIGNAYNLGNSNAIGMTENALYFVWGSSSQTALSTKTVYGVTIYDNGYEIISNDLIDNKDDNTEKEVTVEENNNETKEEVKEEVKEVKEEKTVENPKTGIITLGIGAVVLLGISVIIYLIIRKKSKFPQSL